MLFVFSGFICNSRNAFALESFLGPSTQVNLPGNNKRQIPSYLPRQYFENEGLNVKNQVVRERESGEFVAPVGYGIGGRPNKNAGKQFDPQRIRRKSGFGLGRVTFGGGS